LTIEYKTQVASVYSRIKKYIKRTPVLPSAYFSKKTGSTILFKCENLQYTNAFKVRGAFSKITAMNDTGKILITTSGGNHGMAVSFAAAQFGMKAIVVVPDFVPQFRIDMIKALGGEVVVHGKTMDELDAKVAEYTIDPRYVYLHPFDDPDVIAGQATIAYELLDEHPDTDVIVASIGGGGLISGVSQYAKSFNPNIKIYGAQTTGANAMSKSLEAGQVVSIPLITSIATSLGATKVRERTFQIVKKNVDKLIVVTDEEAIRDLKDVLDKDKLLVEPASSCNLSAILSGKIPGLEGKKVAVILCGGNFSVEQLKNNL
jgi:threonine dehydratase